jgi:hypothetical protein
MGFGERPKQPASTSFTRANMELEPTMHQQVYLILMRTTFTGKDQDIFLTNRKHKKHIFITWKCKKIPFGKLQTTFGERKNT